MTTFNTSLQHYTPAAGLGIPYDHMLDTFNNTLSLKQGDKAFDFVAGLQLDVTAVGTQNDYTPGTGMIVRWNGASQITVSGVVAHINGDIRIFTNVTAAQAMKFTHQDAGSVAANRIILPATGGQWIGAGGSIGLQYDGTSARWRVLFILPGAPITRAFAAGNYTANGTMTWTLAAGDVLIERYMQHGRDYSFDFDYFTTTVGGVANTQLITSIPGGFTADSAQLALGRASDGSGVASQLVVVPTGTSLQFFKDLALTTNWNATGADNCRLHGNIRLTVQ
jgi:hypothetical protein